VCVCVCERERERQRDNEREQDKYGCSMFHLILRQTPHSFSVHMVLGQYPVC
jgi:hypothetical protein